MRPDGSMRYLLALLLLSCGCTSRNPAELPVHAPVAAAMPDFTLLDHKGSVHSLYREGGGKAVVFVAQWNGREELKVNATRIRRLSAEYSDRGVEFFLINANPRDGREAIISEARKLRTEVPILLDPSQVVTRQLGLTRAAEAVILQTGTWRPVYRGDVSGNLDTALEELLSGKPVSPASVPAAGSPLTFVDHGTVSYASQIAPVLREKCLSCHSAEGHYKPYFDSHAAIKGWASMIRETVLTERMPPFSADPLYGKYKNDPTLTPEEKGRLFAWIDAGAPIDGKKDPLATLPPVAVKRSLPPKIWEVGMDKPQNIGPQGTVEYQFFQVGGPAPYDMWVTALHTKSSNPSQLHHESLMISAKPLADYERQVEGVRDAELVKKHPDGDVPFWTMDVIKKNELNRDKRYARFSAWAAGKKQPHFFPKGTGAFIPKGYYLLLEVHYVGNGKQDTEQTRIELFGQRKQGELLPLRTMQVATNNIEIPAGRRRYITHTKPSLLEEDIRVVGFLSHMHMRGRAIRLMEINEDGVSRVLVSIPNFDFNWQSGATLLLDKPMLLKKGSRLEAVCEYDNSPLNPLNPDASKDIRHGQTLDRAEMCKFMLSYTSLR
jgi:hypothetical protein